MSGVPPGSPQQDHPRIRGEHRFCPTTSYGRQGSSPHPRGTPLCYTHSKQLSGIIPASAGNTASGKLRSPPPWDHPRIRGEHPDRAVRMVLILGSSPHPRGTPIVYRGATEKPRIIPASAGNTFVSEAFKCLMGDHPRIRGEHSVYDILFWFSRGSSPHPRGTPLSFSIVNDGDGIIPASAGNTPVYFSSAPSRRDHPRIRGEHTKKIPENLLFSIPFFKFHSVSHKSER